MENIEYLYDHYKDTCSKQESNLKKRSKLTMALIAIVSALLLYSATPQTIENATGEYLKSTLGNVTIEFKYINTILLFILLWIWMQYCQIVLTIESLYVYIHCLETNISTNKKEELNIYRESKAYLNSYPWLKSFSHFIYKTLFPIVVIGTSILKMIQECNNVMYYNYILDVVLIVVTVILALLYISNRCFHEEAFSSENRNKKFFVKFKEYIGAIRK